MFATYNRLDLTKRMLDSLFKNTNTDFNLIIVDNGSVDGTVDYLKSLSPINQCKTIDIIYNEKNLGIAVARNQALYQANSYQNDWLSTLDNDVGLPYNWLNDCIDIISANPHFSIGINMEDVSYPLQTRGSKTFQVKPMGNLGTACTVFHKRLHSAIGYFNTDYDLYGEEDADFFFRARIAGCEIGYLPTMGIHFGSGENDVGEYRDWKTQMHAQNKSKFQKTCGEYRIGARPIYIAWQPGKE